MNNPSPEQLKAWADSYLKGTISESDKAALEAWYTSLPETHQKDIEWNEPGLRSAKALQSRIFDAIDKKIGKEETRTYKTWWLPFSSAAAILAAIVLVFFYTRQHRSPEQPTAATTQPVKDIQPGSTQATLLLADGKAMEINGRDSMNVTARAGAVCVLDKAGKLTYQGSVASPDVYNTVITHKGQQSPPLILPDGTKVWLNAASTLHFPVTFRGQQRQVSLTGEAYFEVAKNLSHPFVVRTAENKIEVLGTHFDIKAYDDEPLKYATLLEGAIRVSNEHHSVQLSPGEQSQTAANGNIVTGKVTANQYIAWMYGELPLNSMDIKNFLREVARWYDVDILYEGEPPLLTFSGVLDKDVPISQILSALNANGIHCILKDKTVVVSGGL